MKLMKYLFLLTIVVCEVCSEESKEVKPAHKKAYSEKQSKIIFGQGNKCKDAQLKDKDQKGIFSWLIKDCPNKPDLPEKPLFNKGVGTLPIPTDPPMIPADFPKDLKPLLPVE